MPQADWTFQAQTRATTSVPSGALASLTDLYDRGIDVFLNQPGNVVGKMDLESPQARRDWLTPGVHELLVLRDEGDGNEAVETVFQLATAHLDPDEEGSGTLELGWLGILSYLSDVTIGPGYGVTGAQDAVAWNVISTIQAKTNADYGITNGTHTASQPSKTLQVQDEQDGKTAISNLSERENGFDFRINASRQFDTWYPFRGSDRTLTNVLTHGSNCRVLRIPEDASPGAIVNWVKVKGGDGASATAQATDSQVTYGRREAIISYSDQIGSVTVLQAFANSIVANRADPTAVPEVQLDTFHSSYSFGDIWLGDTVRLQATLGVGPYREIDDQFRVVAVHIDLNDEGDEYVSLELNAA